MTLQNRKCNEKDARIFDDVGITMIGLKNS